MQVDITHLIKQAAKSIKAADGLLITSGAGMGVDSGLPDFRGNEGFWKAYPALASRGMSFIEIASPSNFIENPKLAWGFYGHRLNLYRTTKPHKGFSYLLNMGQKCPQSYFVFTSNVDGQYQKSNYDPERIIECHGSIHHLQCTNNCNDKIWRAKDINIEVDNETCAALSPLPTCLDCGAIARPNILMFGDLDWNINQFDQQYKRYEAWLNSVNNLVIIECGAGTHIPTVRHQGDMLDGTLIRINPREPQSEKTNTICIKAKALDAITQLYSYLQ